MVLDKILFFFCSFIFFFLIIKKKFFFSEIYLDKDYFKPQSFHNNPTPRIGGVVIITFSIMYLLFFYPEKNFSYSIFFLGSFFFIMGFLDDYKIKFKPEMRLLVMFLISIIIIYLLEINIHYTQIKFLDNLINFNKLTLALFVCFCVLFIVNGSNFIDGFNGLLTIQYLIILLILYLLIYDFKDLIYLKNYILLSILLSLSFLLFNFPFGKIFLGDGGAYFLGSNLSLIIIEINHFNFFTKFSPFMFACLLFYIFFEVFFSFFRKVFFNKSSPVKPDKEHFHMLLFNFINRKISNPLKSNYLTSIVINLVYFFLIFPIFFIYTSGTKCKMYFFFLIFMYLVFYVLLKKKNFFTDFYKFFSEKF